MFQLVRHRDITGVSGTGVVANGVVWDDGKAVMRWCVDGKPRTTTFYDSMSEVIAIHGHDGATVVQWVDRDVEYFPHPMLKG